MRKVFPTPNLLALQHLRWRRYRLVYRLAGAARLPARKGSALRGAWGHALREGAPALYDRLFECRVPRDHPWARRFRQAPNPYLWRSRCDGPTRYRRGDTLDFELVLVGAANDCLSDLVPVFEAAGRRGIGRDRVRLQLADLAIYPGGDPISLSTAADAPRAVDLEFCTPLRLAAPAARNAKPPYPDPDLLVHRLAERVALLAHFHCDAPLLTDYTDWIALAETIAPRNESLHYTHWARYSARSQQHHSYGGWVGTLRWRGVDPRLMPLLRVGEALHVGKATTVGLGEMRVGS